MPKPGNQLWLSSLPPYIPSTNKSCLPHLKIYLHSESPSPSLLCISLFSFPPQPSLFSTQWPEYLLESKTIICRFWFNASEGFLLLALTWSPHLSGICYFPCSLCCSSTSLYAVSPTHQVCSHLKAFAQDILLPPPSPSRFVSSLSSSLSSNVNKTSPDPNPTFDTPNFFTLSYLTLSLAHLFRQSDFSPKLDS